MKLIEVVDFLFNKYPISQKEEWDPSGWSVKYDLNKEITGITLAIDLTSDVLNKAIKSNSNLIFTHHPFLFEETLEEEFLKAPYKKEMLKVLKQKQISVLCFHTNYDNSKYGTSYQITKQLGYSDYVKKYHSNYPCVIELETTINDVIKNIKNTFNFSAIRTNIKKSKLNDKINKIAILSGSGDIVLINELNRKGFDLIITSDPKWNEWILYKETNTPLLEITHLDEQVFVDNMHEVLQKEFKNLKIHVVKMNEPYYNI